MKNQNCSLVQSWANSLLCVQHGKHRDTDLNHLLPVITLPRMLAVEVETVSKVSWVKMV